MGGGLLLTIGQNKERELSGGHKRADKGDRVASVARARRATPERERARERGQGVSIDKNSEGAWRISDFIGEGAGEYLLTRTYYFTSKREAIRLFKKEVRA